MICTLGYLSLLISLSQINGDDHKDTALRLALPRCAQRCPDCHECALNAQSQPKCIYNTGCCPLNSTIVYCAKEPCHEFKKRYISSDPIYSRCGNAAHCLSKHCDACTSLYFDPLWNPVECGSAQTCADVKCTPSYDCKIINKSPICVPRGVTPMCLQSASPGPCKGRIMRYFFNITSETCEPFMYGGCLGNDNNFATERDCTNSCYNCTDEAAPSDPAPSNCRYEMIRNTFGCVLGWTTRCNYKSGICPSLGPYAGTACHKHCTYDNDCEGEMICCSNGCGTDCVAPIFV